MKLPKKRENPSAGESGAKPGSSRTRRATAVLSEKEGTLLSFSDSLGDGAAILDAGGKIKGVNKRFLEILGVPEQRVVGKRLDLVKGVRGQSISRKLTSLLSGQEVSPFEMETRSSTERNLTLQIHFVHNRSAADLRGAVAVIRDLSDQRRPEQGLQSVDERSRLFVENADEGLAVVQDGKVVFMNQRVADLSGRPIEEHLSRPFLEYVYPADQDMVRKQHLGRVKGAPVPRVYSFRVARPDGSVRWAEVSAVAHAWEGKAAFLYFVKDVTERVKVEDELRESERRYRLMAENASDVIWMIDADLRIGYVSPSLTSLLGYSMEEALALDFGRMLSPDSLARVMKEYDDALATEKGKPGGMKGQALDIEVVRKDGSTVWLEAAINVMRDKEGRFTGYQGACRDITERRKAQEALRESERRYRLLAENVSDVIWVTDMNLHATYLSPSIKRLLGYSMEESMRHTVEGALTPASVEAVQKVLAGVVARGRLKPGISAEMDVELRRKDGSTVWVESTVSFIMGADGQPAEIMGVLRDISKRRQAEEALREAKAKLDLLLQQMPCLSWTTDTDLRFISCAGALLSASRIDRLIGTNLSDYYGTNGGEDRTPLSAHRQALAGITGSYEVEERGRAFYCRVEPLRNAVNDLMGVVGAAVDITDYKNLVGQLRTLSRRLISVQEDERRTIASELHDQVGQSLTALKLLLEKAEAMASESDSRQLTVARGVVNELMTRVREMSLDLRPAMLDDLGLLPTLLWHFKRYTDHTQVKVKFRHGGLRRPLPPEVSIAAYRIVQEALTNVARYAKVKEVSVCVRAERGMVLVEVADHGVGFSEARLAGQPSSGLRGMRERALALDGKFTVKSVPGRGTYVMAELPCGSALKKGKEEQPRPR